MKLKPILLILLYTTAVISKTTAQSPYNKTRIDSIVKMMLLTKAVDRYSFTDTLALTGQGYHNANYLYAVDKQTKKIIWLKLWYNSQEQSDTYYFSNNKIIKAIIGVYMGSQPKTTFYFWNNKLIHKEPNSSILNWEAFIELGYASLQRVKKYVGKKI